MCTTGEKYQTDGVRKMKVTYEQGWECMNIHVDLPVPYEDNYQIKMLDNNEIKGLLSVKGTGMDGNARYTFRIGNGNTMIKEYAGKDLKKGDILRFTEDLAETVDQLREYMLDPDHLLLSPEFVVVDKGRYRFCYLPVSGEGETGALCSAFHAMTEYFVKHLDYQDTGGVFLACKMHKETMKESYELRRIMESCEEEEEKEKQRSKSEERRKSISDAAVFTVNDTEEEKKDHYNRATDTEMICEEPVRYSPFRKAVSRMRIGRWGQWEDLITEMDGQKQKGHL